MNSRYSTLLADNILRCLLAAYLVLAPTWGGASSFVPPDGKSILFVGQEKREIAAYRESVGEPSGYMLYTDISTLSGMDGAHRGRGCADSGTMDFQDWIQHYPGTASQIGLYLVGNAESVASGMIDDNIVDLGEFIRAAKSPVYLRIGYEFDGPWNKYHPSIYKQAWVRIARILRGDSLGKVPPISPVTNVALVWHSAAYSTFGDRTIGDWYPGDEYVDWVALSWFPWASPSDNAVAEEARQSVAEFASLHHKPLMIAESSPKRYYQANKTETWDQWHAPVFRWIEEHNVKAYSFINQDWDAMPQWHSACGNGSDWGNTRLQIPGGDSVLQRWQQQLNTNRWLKPGEDLYKAIGF